MNKKNRLQVAIHEAGHAVVGDHYAWVESIDIGEQVERPGLVSTGSTSYTGFRSNRGKRATAAAGLMAETLCDIGTADERGLHALCDLEELRELAGDRRHLYVQAAADAKRIILERRDILMAITEALLKEDHLGEQDLERLFGRMS